MIRDQVDAGAVHARHIDAIAAAQFQFADVLAVEFRLGDHDPARDELVVELFPLLHFHVDLLAEKVFDQLRVIGRRDDHYLVADAERSLRVGDLDMPVGPEHARDDELTVYQSLDLQNGFAVEKLVFDFYRNADRLARVVLAAREYLILLVEADTEDPADEKHRQDNADHAERIGYRITRRDVGRVDSRHVGIGLLRCAQSGRVGHGAGEDTHDGRDVQSRRQMDDVGGDHAQKDDGRRQHVQLHAAFLERREEAGSYLQADRVDEQNQPELFDEMDQMLVELHPEMAERDSDEKNPRHAEPDSADFELAERDAERDHQRENQHRVGDASAPERAVAEKKIMKPFHIKKCTDRLFRWSGLESLAGGAGVADGRACPDSGCEGTKLSGTCGCRIVRGALFY